MKSPLIVALIVLLFSFPAFSQVPGDDLKGLFPYSSEPILSMQDSFLLSNLPKLTLPKNLSESDLPELPAYLNNARLPYFRPVFSQGSSASCGQASGVAYNFTFEINSARNLPANIPENQYPTHYHWNFSNGGHGWYGSSYLHSLEIIRTNGSPTIADYGGMDYGGNSRWMNGYENYYNGMHHRIEGVYTIEVGDEQGLITLKHWLHNHLNGSATGGVASFYASSPWDLKTLPAGTPDAGKRVVKNFYNPATHALVVVGWNDSIRWDYNGDGLYTNHIDLNGDGIVDMRDWEKGGLIFANSYGITWADSGFCYMTYRTVAEHMHDGGIWNYAMHVLKVIPDYLPLLTAKITLKHPARGRIKVIMGVSENTESEVPLHTIDYPIFNFHGSDLYMQGGTTEDQKTIEFGLDITPLLEFTNPGQPARYFLQIKEYDPGSQFQGEVVGFSVLDYTQPEPIEYAYPNSNVSLINNSTTTLGINASVGFTPVTITTENLPPAIENQMVSHEMQAGGGLEPYSWKIVYNYLEHTVAFDPMTDVDQQILPVSGPRTWETVNLGFDFPFFDTVYTQLSVYPNGFLMFNDEPFPYIFWLDPMVFMRTYSLISVFMSPDIKVIEANGDGVFIEQKPDRIYIKWFVTYVWGSYQYPLQFGAILYSDGKIECHYAPMQLEKNFSWLGGLSLGDKLNYFITSNSGQLNFVEPIGIAFTPTSDNGFVRLSETGLISYQLPDMSKVNDITLQAKDSRGIGTRKTFQLTDGLLFNFNTQQKFLSAGKESMIDVFLKNTTSENTGNILICFDSPGSENVEWLDACYNVANMPPGDSIHLKGIARFLISSSAPESSIIPVRGTMNFDSKTREKTIYRIVNQPKLVFSGINVEGTIQNTVSPGLSYTLNILVTNSGEIPAQDVKVVLSTDEPFLILQPPFSHEMGTINYLGGAGAGFQFRVHPKALSGSICNLIANLYADDEHIMKAHIALIIDKTKIITIDVDPRQNSITRMAEDIFDLKLASDAAPDIPADINNYDIVFLGLGVFPNNHKLTISEGEILRDYLLQGGNLYLESGTTWRGDPKVAVHELFNIQGVNQGWPYGIDSLVGLPGTFTEGLNFKYMESQLKKTDNMQPLGDAFSIFKDIPTGFNYAVAFQNEAYKTIGSTFRYGPLFSWPQDTLPQRLLEKYLQFFGFYPENLLAANFSADQYQICNGDWISFSPRCYGPVENWDWSFNGGIPAASTEYNPVIKYDAPGTYSVRLIVSNEFSSDTLLLENLITVESCSGINKKEKEQIKLYPNPANDYVVIQTIVKTPSPVSVSIYNSFGAIVLHDEYLHFCASQPLMLDLQTLPRGLYIIRVSSKDSTLGSKLLIHR